MTRVREIDGTLKPSVPYVELLGATTENYIDTGYNPIMWCNIYTCTSDFEYREDTTYTGDVNGTLGYIYVYTTGFYLIDFAMQFSLSSGGVTVGLLIKLNDVDIQGGSNYQYGKYYQHTNISKLVYLQKGDEVSFFFYSNADYTEVNIPDDCSEGMVYYAHARISYVPMGGWNNDTGGNIIDRGVKR